MVETIAPPEERVAAGVAALDAKDPGWWRADIEHAIDLGSLNMQDCLRCVLGQRFGYFGNGPILAAQAEALGFEALFDGRPGSMLADYEALQAEWTRVIEERRDLEADRAREVTSDGA